MWEWVCGVAPGCEMIVQAGSQCGAGAHVEGVEAGTCLLGCERTVFGVDVAKGYPAVGVAERIYHSLAYAC